MKQRLYEFTGLLGYIVLYFYWAWYLHGSQRARIIVLCNDSVLLVKPWLGLGGWDIPGGGMHGKEELATTATRELHEETSIKVDDAHVHFVDKLPISHGLIRFTAHYYVVRVDKMDQPSPSMPEIARAQWVPRKKLNEFRIQNDVRRVVVRCFEK